MIERQVRMMKSVLLLSSVASILILAAAAYQEHFRAEWRDIQAEYREALIRTAGNDDARMAASAYRIEFKQAFLEGLGGVDRCVSCHLGVENPAMSGADQPLRRHSGKWLVNHPTDSFGCTICHGGEGRATRKEAAHGWRENGSPTPHVATPLLRGDAVYASCGRCHYEVDLYAGQTDLYAYSFGAGSVEIKKPQIDESILTFSLPGAEVLAEGKRLVVENGCLGCHRYRGGGGDLGADLTHIGDKTKHDFDFTHVKGEHTVLQWHYEHFLRPGAISSGTVMPNMDFTRDEAQSLALYMTSLRRKSAPATHTPRPLVTTVANAAPASGETLYKMFCCACHGESGRGDGPAAKTIEGNPRDFWHERFRYVSTQNGVPTQEDLVKTISTGRRFGEMPANPQLTESEVLAVAEYIRSLNRAGWVETLTAAFADDDDIDSEEIEEIAEARVTPRRIIIVPWPGESFEPDTEVGRALFLENCASCHGPEGRGDGPQELVDERGRKIRARDLSSGDFRGGGELDEIYKRIRAGMPGTPMPAQASLSDDEIWQLVHYVHSIAGNQPG